MTGTIQEDSPGTPNPKPFPQLPSPLPKASPSSPGRAAQPKQRLKSNNNNKTTTIIMALPPSPFRDLPGTVSSLPPSISATTRRTSSRRTDGRTVLSDGWELAGPARPGPVQSTPSSSSTSQGPDSWGGGSKPGPDPGPRTPLDPSFPPSLSFPSTAALPHPRRIVCLNSTLTNVESSGPGARGWGFAKGPGSGRSLAARGGDTEPPLTLRTRSMGLGAGAVISSGQFSAPTLPPHTHARGLGPQPWGSGAWDRGDSWQPGGAGREGRHLTPLSSTTLRTSTQGAWGRSLGPSLAARGVDTQHLAPNHPPPGTRAKVHTHASLSTPRGGGGV